MLNRLLQAKSIAVIGGGAWCEAVIEQNKKLGFDGEIWPVHPKRDEVAGLRAYPNLKELPDVPDAAFVGVNRNTTIDVVAELSAMGAGGAICFASGFREAEDGIALNEQLLAAAGTMPILGPNCYGLLNALDSVALWPDQHGLTPVKSGVAIVTQSSNIAINLTMQQRGLPIAYVVTAGNQAQQGLADIASTLLDDTRVTALGFYVESFGDVAAFETMAAKAHELRKPIVILKAGRSEASQKATISHTASLAGSSAGADALMTRLGIASVLSLPAFLETLKIFHCHGLLDGKRIASLSCSGGEAGVMADTAERYGITFPPLEAWQREVLAEQLSLLVTLTNPLDYHTDIWRNRAAMTDVFATMTGESICLTCIILDFPRGDVCDSADWLITLDAIEVAAAQTGRPFAVLASMGENLPEAIAKRLIDKGVVPLIGFEEACAAIAAATTPNRRRNVPLLRSAEVSKHLETLNEGDAKCALANAGLDVPRSQSGLTIEQLSKATLELGFPLVLKGEGIAHKSDQGAVALNLHDANVVMEAAEKMQTTSFLLEEMVTEEGVELLIGIVRDPAHGFVLTIAAGGVLTELLDDKTSLLVPSSRDSVEAGLNGLKIANMLRGYRGALAADVSAVVKAIMALQEFVIDNAETLVEIEINPLICTPSRAVVADALFVREKS